MTVERTREVEPQAVQLTRMEGDLKLVLKLLDNQGAIITQQGLDISELKSKVQKLESDFTAERDKALALALALKDADDTRRNQETRAWTPFTKFLAVLAVIVAIGSLYIQVRHGVPVKP